MKHTSDAILHGVQSDYLERLELSSGLRGDELLAKMEKLAAKERQPISDPEVATFLFVTISAAGAKRIVEVGTNIGYGAIVMARAAGVGAHVITIEKSHDLCEVARAHAKEAKLESAIDVREGDALLELAKIEGPIDFAYVDCVKEDYVRYLELLEPRLRSGGVLVADNVLWRGLVAAEDRNVPDGERARVTALRAFNEKLTTSPKFRAVILPLGDGVAYAVKI